MSGLSQEKSETNVHAVHIVEERNTKQGKKDNRVKVNKSIKKN